MLPVEEPEDQPERAPVFLGEEHGLTSRGGHRFRETDPVSVGLPSLVDEAAGERTGRFGERAQPELPEEGPLVTLELPDAHAGRVEGNARHGQVPSEIRESAPSG
jgi:hypothetical protein